MKIPLITQAEYENKLDKCKKYTICPKNPTEDDILKLASEWDEIGCMRARLEAELAVAESELKRIEGETYRAIKKNPAQFGLDKVNETSIKYVINSDSEVSEARENVALATLRAMRFKYMYEAMTAKRQYYSRKEFLTEDMTKNQ